MSSITLLRGVPASGKSTFATAWLAESPETRFRINRDEIRYELFNTWYPVEDENGTVKEKEAKVTNVEHQRVEKALREGKDIIVDNTNLTRSLLEHTAKLLSVSMFRCFTRTSLFQSMKQSDVMLREIA